MQQSILVFFRVSKERLKRLHVRRFTRLSNLPPNSPKPDDSGYRLDACSYGGRCVSPFAHCFSWLFAPEVAHFLAALPWKQAAEGLVAEGQAQPGGLRN